MNHNSNGQRLDIPVGTCIDPLHCDCGGASCNPSPKRPAWHDAAIRERFEAFKADPDAFEVPPEIPLREHLAPRIPDLCPDGELLPHNPETCRDPACECWPF